MTFAQRKLLVLAAWSGAVLAVGLTLAGDTPNLWVLIASLTIIPTVVGHWLWAAPEATLSQVIVQARSRS